MARDSENISLPRTQLIYYGKNKFIKKLKINYCYTYKLMIRRGIKEMNKKQI